MKVLGITGSMESNNINNIKYEILNTNVMSMDFFERLNNDICPNGHIRGCFEETYDGNISFIIIIIIIISIFII
jgi:hypothetical protein